ncbi:MULTISPECIES: hypothetical protein [Stenotrophomonas maltophilia group]|uniref:hypothetical protein n=1 Tax=Stenotrophomonas maltophilia group TaxID=995085 RepID=UPI0015DE0128|nr:hypothetical protein [Stenotrophomonas maltophilia]MDZ5814306.1 hypothetical protein [Stenotrophomonas maltophilia]
MNAAAQATSGGIIFNTCRGCWDNDPLISCQSSHSAAVTERKLIQDYLLDQSNQLGFDLSCDLSWSVVRYPAHNEPEAKFVNSTATPSPFKPCWIDRISPHSSPAGTSDFPDEDLQSRFDIDLLQSLQLPLGPLA